jgi:hypothetical protein
MNPYPLSTNDFSGSSGLFIVSPIATPPLAVQEALWA